jgi:hypothetical protein
MIAACVRCRTHLFPKRNSQPVFEIQPGSEKRIAIWDADLWECPTCGFQIVMGFGEGPISDSPAQLARHNVGDVEVFTR